MLSLRDIQKLEELRKTLTMESANFDNLWDEPEDPLPQTEREVTSFVQRRTETWRRTWVFPVLDGLIEKHRKAHERR